MQLRPCDSLFPQNGGGILPEGGRIGNEGIQVNHNSPTPHFFLELRILKELREDFRKKQILKKLDRSLGKGEKSARGRCEGSSWPSCTIPILAQPQTHVNANFAVIHMPTCDWRTRAYNSWCCGDFRRWSWT